MSDIQTMIVEHSAEMYTVQIDGKEAQSAEAEDNIKLKYNSCYGV